MILPQIGGFFSTLLARGEFFSTLDGGKIKVSAESLCLHGDTAHALNMANDVRDKLTNAGFVIKAC